MPQKAGTCFTERGEGPAPRGSPELLGKRAKMGWIEQSHLEGMARIMRSPKRERATSWGGTPVKPVVLEQQAAPRAGVSSVKTGAAPGVRHRPRQSLWRGDVG